MSDGTIKKIKLPDNKVYDIEPSFSSVAKNYVLAGPTTGDNVEPVFRKLVASDIPNSIARTYSPIFTGEPIAPDYNSEFETSSQIATINYVQNFLGDNVLTTDSLGKKPGGIPQLDNSGLISTQYLPSYVDNVKEYESLSNFPATGENGIIYAALDTNLFYRWSGSMYVAIGNGGENLALGETHSTAYYGDYGAIAYAHATTNTPNYTQGLYKIAINTNGHVTAATAVEKSDIVALGIPEENTTYSSLDETNGIGSTDVSLVTRGEKYIWNHKGNGTVTSITADVGLDGGKITTSGTISLKLSDTSQMSYSASTASPVANRTYPVRLDSNGNLAVNVPWEAGESTNTLTYIYAGTSSGASNNTVSSGNVYIKVADDSSVNNSIQLKGSGNTTVTATNGVITINTSVDTSSFITSSDLGAAAYKGVVTSISSSSNDNNVPTAKAVYKYITDNMPSNDDTTNTTGTGDVPSTTSTYYIPGATTRSSTGVQTYSSSKVYFNNDKLYSNSKEVVNLSDSQNLTNKT